MTAKRKSGRPAQPRRPRTEIQAQALRDNLRRRKQQQRAREEPQEEKEKAAEPPKKSG